MAKHYQHQHFQILQNFPWKRVVTSFKMVSIKTKFKIAQQNMQSQHMGTSETQQNRIYLRILNFFTK